ncbi:MAG TPA: cellulase family glycosylhydrolase [Tepidisphaeraceae bacterium]|nr:cellulase family glycosylhydrolase [Tepidisphaeraceae bacterium]
MRTALLALWVVVSLGTSGFGGEPALGLTVNVQGVLCKDGRPYRGIGVNFFDCFVRTLRKPGDTSHDEGFRILAEHDIPFARFMACGFWPAEMKLYHQDPAAYFQLMDQVVKSAEKHGIGLIPSFFWFIPTVPDMVGESCDQWGNPQSKTRQFMRTYTRQIVTRYKDSPAIWGWEFGNEYNLDADLPNAKEHRPPVVPAVGTPTTRSQRDELTHAMIRDAFADFASEVQRHDPHHRLIASGNAFPRPTAWHQMTEKSWGKDTPEQYEQMLLGDNPDPMNVISVHAYGEVDIKPSLAIARKAKKPLFVGEFGVLGGDDAPSRVAFMNMLHWVETEPVPLAAVWAFDCPDTPEWNIRLDNPRAYQLQAIAAANRRLHKGSHLD